MRRTRIFVLVVLLIATGFAPMFAGGRAEASADPAGPTPISVLTPEDGGRVFRDTAPTITAIEARTNTDIFVDLTPSAEFQSKMNVLAASGTLPDIINTRGYDHIPYATQGVLLELDDLLEEYGPNVLDLVPAEVLDMVRIDGSLYAIPFPNFPGKWNLSIRQDWLDEQGLELPTTLEEFIDTLEALRDAYPDVYPYGGYHGGTANLGANFTPIFGSFGIHPGYYSVEDGGVSTHVISDEYREALAVINDMYERELMDPEMLIDSTDQARQKLLTGRVASYTGWWSITPVILMRQYDMPSISPGVEWSLIEPLTSPNGSPGVFQGLSPVANAVSIARNSDNPVEAMQLINFLASNEGQLLVNFGVEGEHYSWEDGVLVRTAEATQWNDEKWFDPLSQVVKDNPFVVDILFGNDETRKFYITAAAENPLIIDAFDGIITEERQMLESDVTAFQEEQFILFVTGQRPLSEFDAYVNEWLRLGGQEMRQSMLEVFNERNGTNYSFIQ